MAAVPGARCAEIAGTLDEPMVGTAPSTRRWLCLERTEPWAAHINHDRDPGVRALLTRAAAAGFRPLMIRGTERGPDRRPPRIFLTDTAPGRTVTTVLDIERPGQLDDVPLPEPDHPLPGVPVTGPLLLICTHEQRDPCCGLEGRALVDAIAGPGVFAASHLGGHRFAPTALVLPTGYAYGRLESTSAAAIHAGAAAGVITTDRCRGRSTWSPQGQVAELAVRESTGPHSPDALTVEDDSGDTVHVAAATGERWAVDVEPVDVDATRPASCGARFTLMVPLRAAAVRVLRPSS
jgi:Sucrase/ferredoxin-like